MRTPFIKFIIGAFLINSLGPLPVQANELILPKPGVMVRLSPPMNSPLLKGIKVYPNNPFKFDFILDQGDGTANKDEAQRLIKYFLASVTVPEEDLWVNLSPYEKNRIIPDAFGKTEMGRDLLAQDYLLKQITASLIYPEEQVGKEFWQKIYAEAQKKFGTTNIPVNTFNKVWIVPQKALVYENKTTAYVVEANLKVMLEQDYLALEKSAVIPALPAGRQGRVGIQNKNDINAIGSQIVREIVIPQLEREVNEGKNFALLRQVYHSLILAMWYKQKIKKSILAKIYADKRKVAGVGYDSINTDLIYQQYLQAFKKGVFNYIKEEVDPATQEMIPRKYISGGVELRFAPFVKSNDVANTNLTSSLAMTSDPAMLPMGSMQVLVSANISSAAMVSKLGNIEILPKGGKEETEVLTKLALETNSGRLQYFSRFKSGVMNSGAKEVGWVDSDPETYFWKINIQKIRDNPGIVGVVKEERDGKIVYWMLKKELIFKQDREEFYKNTAWHERFAYLFALGKANLTEVKLVSAQDAVTLGLQEGHYKYYLSRLVFTGNIEHMPHMDQGDLKKAFSSILVAHLALKLSDHWLPNFGFLGNVPVGIDHDQMDLINAGNSKGREQYDLHFLAFFLFHAVYRALNGSISMHSWDEVHFDPDMKRKIHMLEMMATIRVKSINKQFGFGSGFINAENLDRDEIAKSIEEFKGGVDRRAIRKMVYLAHGYDTNDLVDIPAHVRSNAIKVEQHLIYNLNHLGRNMENLWESLTGQKAHFERLDQQSSAMASRPISREEFVKVFTGSVVLALASGCATSPKLLQGNSMVSKSSSGGQVKVDGAVPVLKDVQWIFDNEKEIKYGFYQVGEFKPGKPTAVVIHGATNDPSRVIKYLRALEKEGNNIFVYKYTARDSLEKLAQGFRKGFAQGVYGRDKQSTVVTFSYGGHIAAESVFQQLKSGEENIFRGTKMVMVGPVLAGSIESRITFHPFVGPQLRFIKALDPTGFLKFSYGLRPGSETALRFRSGFNDFLKSVGSFGTIIGDTDSNYPLTNIKGKRAAGSIDEEEIRKLNAANNEMLFPYMIGGEMFKGNHTDIIDGTDETVRAVMSVVNDKVMLTKKSPAMNVQLAAPSAAMTTRGFIKTLLIGAVGAGLTGRISAVEAPLGSGVYEDNAKKVKVAAGKEGWDRLNAISEPGDLRKLVIEDNYRVKQLATRLGLLRIEEYDLFKKSLAFDVRKLSAEEIKGHEKYNAIVQLLSSSFNVDVISGNKGKQNTQGLDIKARMDLFVKLFEGPQNNPVARQRPDVLVAMWDLLEEKSREGMKQLVDEYPMVFRQWSVNRHQVDNQVVDEIAFRLKEYISLGKLKNAKAQGVEALSNPQVFMQLRRMLLDILAIFIVRAPMSEESLIDIKRYVLNVAFSKDEGGIGADYQMTIGYKTAAEARMAGLLGLLAHELGHNIHPLGLKQENLIVTEFIGDVYGYYLVAKVFGQQKVGEYVKFIKDSESAIKRQMFFKRLGYLLRGVDPTKEQHYWARRQLEHIRSALGNNVDWDVFFAAVWQVGIDYQDKRLSKEMMAFIDEPQQAVVNGEGFPFDKFIEQILLRYQKLTGKEFPKKVRLETVEMPADVKGGKVKIHLFKGFSDDKAMMGVSETGGIDLTSGKLPLEVQQAGAPIQAFGDDNDDFNIDPAMLQQLQNAPGFMPVIINIQPMADLKAFLGVGNQDPKVSNTTLAAL